MVLIFGAIIPALGDYEAVGETLRNVSAEALVLLLVIFAVNETMKAVVPVIVLSGLRRVQSVVAEETSAVISYTVPGPSGTATRYAIYASWGLDVADFGRATIVNSVMNNACLMLMPLLVTIPLSAEHSVPTGLWWIAVGCGLLSIVGLVIVGCILRSERFARRIGSLPARCFA